MEFPVLWSGLSHPAKCGRLESAVAKDIIMVYEDTQAKTGISQNGRSREPEHAHADVPSSTR